MEKWWVGGSCGRQNPAKKNGIISVITLFILLFTFLVLWHSQAGELFQYHGQSRWSGPWDNPNIFGLLMGTGLVVAMGQFIQSLISEVQGQNLGDGSWQLAVRRYTIAIVCFLAALLMGRGLLHSYSRGAWLATVCGVVFLISELGIRNSELFLCFKKNWLSVSVILLSAAVLAFWQFGHTRNLAARRFFSVENVNDFSWRNRVVAWEGALQIMAERPWLGASWNQPEPLYEHYYLPSKLNESAAIEMNGYLMLGATIGIPALFCFGMYLWLSLKQTFVGVEVTRLKLKAGIISRKLELNQTLLTSYPTDFTDQKLKIGDRLETRPMLDIGHWTLDWLKATCHAGAIVLLIGFWFDGGLFKLATAATFLVLLELGRQDLRQVT